MANVATTMDALKQATVNSLYNVICNNGACTNMKFSYSNNTINSNNSILNANCYISTSNNISCITMANLPYAVSWLRNPQKVGADTNKLALIPNDVSVLNQNGSMSNGSLAKYTAGSLSIVDGNNNDYCIKLCNPGYCRGSLYKNISKASISGISGNENTLTVTAGYTNTNLTCKLGKATCAFDPSTAKFTVNTGYVDTALTCTLDKSSLTGDVVLTPSTPSVTISPGYTGGGTVKMSSDPIDIFGSNYVTWVKDSKYLYDINSKEYFSQSSTCEGAICYNVDSYTITCNLYLMQLIGPISSNFHINFNLCIHGCDDQPITTDYYAVSTYNSYLLGGVYCTEGCTTTIYHGAYMNRDIYAIIDNEETIPKLITYVNITIFMEGISNNNSTVDPYYYPGTLYYCYHLKFDCISSPGDTIGIAYFNQFT